MSEAIDVGGRGGLRGQIDYQHRYPAALTAITPSAAEDAFAILPQWLGDIFSIGWR
jgi:hypothetical protein